MSAKPKLNISSIIGIKEGIYQVFSLIDQNLDAYSKYPSKLNPIRDCKNYIHQLDGLFEMLGLSSITIVSDKMEQLVEALLIQKIQPNSNIYDALKQSNKALLYYLNELIDGKEENPLRLYPAYRGLMQVYGFENAPESDLFFPRLAVNPAFKPESVPNDAATIKALTKQIGAEFQTGLLKWLRDPSDNDGLQKMAGAVSRLEEFPGTTEQRAFWWVTSGFLEDLLQQQYTQVDLAIRRLCGKIEQTIRHFVTDSPDNTATLMRELLYHISICDSSSPRIADIKGSYVWPGQTDELITLEQAEALQPILAQLRSTLMQANDIWREFCAGHQDSLTSLLDYVDWLAHQARQTQCTPLVKLIDVITHTITYLHDHPKDISEELAMEMATALLLVESILDDINKLPADISNQIELLAARLHQITTSDQHDFELAATPIFNAIDSRTQEKELNARVAQEILVNLKQIENILDKFFFERSKCSELSALSGLFKQVSGALVMLELERADTLLNLCWDLVKKLLEPDFDIVESEQILLVDGLSSLAFFIEAFKSGQPDSYQIIEEAITLFQIASVPGSAPLRKPATAMAPTNAVKSVNQISAMESAASDPELLAIFLQEADEVLADITSELQHYHSNPANTEALIKLRRAFHTLKGSGRMVKLDTMSEVAEKLEQVIDLWHSEQRPASNRLVDLISRTYMAYKQWCKNLREHGETAVYADELFDSANALINEKDSVISFIQAKESITTTPAPEGLSESEHIPVTTPAQSPAIKTTVESLIPQQSDNHANHEINPELLPAFLEEAHPIVPQIGSKLRAWRILPHDEDIHHALLRLLHTLKGSARMAGAIRLGESIHRMESRVESAFHDRTIADSAIDQLEREFDAISGMIEYLQNNALLPATTSYQGITHEEIADTTPATEKTESLSSKSILRINSALIDRLVNDSGEASILRSKIETQLHNFKQSLQDLAESTHRLHDQLREVEIQAETQMQSHLAQRHDSEHTFDPLELDRFTRFQELTRLMAESVDDIVSVQKSLRTTHSAAEEAVAQQSVINRQLQQSLLQIRTVPFSNFAERYYRIARQVAEEMNKKANLQINGADVEIDRNVLETINPPLEHLLRNAIAHGIEEPLQRLQAGKPEAGQITIDLRQERNEVIITVNDDGIGLNLQKIRKEAVRLGLAQKNDVFNDDKIMSLIFTPGLSTTDSVTDIAGRGIGLDIVKNEITTLGGRIGVSSILNQGTTFTIYLPLMLSVAQTLIVRTAKQAFAIPAFIVECQRDFDPDAIRKIYQDHCIALNGKSYPFAHLSHLLGDTEYTPTIAKHNQVLFLHSSTQYLAIHVDELISQTEVVIKNTGSQLAHAPGVEGVTISGNGEIILILNPVKLLQRDDAQRILSTPLSKLAASAQKKSPKPPSILVVDDSLTVRKVTCRLLEREGCDVLIAKNGVEALEILQDTTPDVLLIDLEMPKMNGFELIKNVRATPRVANIPIIIISSRTADKHQQIAKSLGVNIFLGKPFKEEDLLNQLSKFIKKKHINLL
ncbi:MAG: hybrid sensor histidine kinase/response regulator [Nitrosomonas sp. PRO4]|nr:hybrid sensor histidine kinase/response regulator [Nitrosomonas sp. PRO4]